MYNVYTDILGWDKKDIDRTKLFVIFNNRGITENGFGAIFHSLFPLWSVSTMPSFSFLLFWYEFTYVTVSWIWLFSLNNSFLFSYSLVSFIFTMQQHKILVTAPNLWHFLLLIYIKVLQVVKFSYVIRFEFLKLVVSTSSVVWSQVRWFFILEYFCAINHGEKVKSFRISSMFYCLYYYPVLYNAIYIGVVQ